ncbi:hypothetical protein BO86DRAFT_15191 [Aspergillus japonicus CBS 114.51]|uniref:Uncharacterized protein n=1 Tax=Aspergillus japonicus CBS 114.51 TaxID=1448312 RepID=A0A8T8X7V0_ASPJA|nr:hypothetical protein BO86DRAFT_15191 [Aspergillus japonicus CBS 114.51]RAH84206.1 hypothetical protein BO86DRAFT_15191 [Aspergillus japonicus CBS 114.51]
MPPRRSLFNAVDGQTHSLFSFLSPQFQPTEPQSFSERSTHYHFQLPSRAAYQLRSANSSLAVHSLTISYIFFFIFQYDFPNFISSPPTPPTNSSTIDFLCDLIYLLLLLPRPRNRVYS